MEKAPQKTQFFKLKGRMCEAIGISHNTLNAYMRMDGFPAYEKDRGWPLDDVLRFLKDNAQRSHLASKANPDLADLKVKELGIKIEKLIFNLEKEKGEWLPLAETKQQFRVFWGKFLAMLRQKLENEYPKDVAGMEIPAVRVYGKKLVDDIVEQSRQLLGEFAASNDHGNTDKISGRPDEPPAVQDQTGVGERLASAPVE